MTKQKLIELLKKKWFSCNYGVDTILLGGKSDIYYKDLRLNDGAFIVLSILVNNDDIYVYFTIGQHHSNDSFLNLENLTEQKLDEILIQFMKIKTSINQLNNIIEGE